MHKRSLWFHEACRAVVPRISERKVRERRLQQRRVPEQLQACRGAAGAVELDLWPPLRPQDFFLDGPDLWLQAARMAASIEANRDAQC